MEANRPLSRVEVLREIRRIVEGLEVLESRLNSGQDEAEILNQMGIMSTMLGPFGERYFTEVMKDFKELEL